MKTEDFRFNYKKRSFNIKVGICDNFFLQISGLMFKKNSLPLLFVFKNSRKSAIHSFFCEKFVAIWFDKDRIVDVKLVHPWKISVKPNKKFDRLLEIPMSNKDFFDFIDDAETFK